MDMVPYNRALTITKSDSVNIDGDRLTSAVYVGGAGALVVVFQNDETQSITAPAGALLPIAIKRVNSTNTNATLMVALYQV